MSSVISQFGVNHPNWEQSSQSKPEAIDHDDVIKWKHFPRNWPFERGIHRSPVNSPHKGQWRGALMFTLICVWINDWVNNREAGDLRCYRAHYDVIVIIRKDVFERAKPSTGTCLTHWGRDKMAAFSQMTFSNAFSSLKMFEFRLQFHWSLFLRFELTIFQHWFR